MKRIISLVLMIALLAGCMQIPFAGAEEETINCYAFVKTPDGKPLNLREKPGTYNKALEQIEDGEKLLVISRNGDWAKVQYFGLTGYVMTKFIEIMDEPGTPQPEPGTETEESWLGEPVDETLWLPYRSDPEVSMEIDFNTEMFEHYSKRFDLDLAKLSILLSTAAYEQDNVPYGRAICNAYHALNIRDEDIMLFNYVGHRLNHPDFTEEDHRLFSIANRKMGDYILLLIVARGSGALFKSPDWLDNISVGFKDSLDVGFNIQVHPGIQEFADQIQIGLSAYLKDHPEVQKAKDEKKLKVLITGHSLGGSVANLFAAYAMSPKKYFTSFDQEDLYVYTFAAPRNFNTLEGKAPATSDCGNIHNVVIDRDPVPKVPEDRRIIWKRFGRTITYKTTYPWYYLDPVHHEMRNYIDAIFFFSSDKTDGETWFDVVISDGI